MLCLSAATWLVNYYLCQIDIEELPSGFLRHTLTPFITSISGMWHAHCQKSCLVWCEQIKDWIKGIRRHQPYANINQRRLPSPYCCKMQDVPLPRKESSLLFYQKMSCSLQNKITLTDKTASETKLQLNVKKKHYSFPHFQNGQRFVAAWDIKTLTCFVSWQLLC